MTTRPDQRPAAVVFDRYGPPEVLRVAPLDPPAPGPGEVTVHVVAAGVNPVDVKVRRGDFSDGQPPTGPQRLGNEFAGIVTAVGTGVTAWQPGDEVLGFTTLASHATHLVVPADALVAKPAGLPWRVAAGLSAAGQTAHHAVAWLGIEPGDTVVVHGAAGGVGTVAVQLAVRRGAVVIGTASPRNHDYLRSLGAIPVVYGTGLADRLGEQAPGGIDAVLDVAGRGAVDASLPLVRDRSRIATTVDDAAADRHGLHRLRPPRSASVLAELAALAAGGALRVPIHLAVPLADAPRAHREVEAGHVRGKVVLVADDALGA